MKHISLIIVLAMLHLIFTSCSRAPKMPEDANFEFWITQDVSDTVFSDYNEIYGWIGAKQYYGSGYQPTYDENGYEVEPEYYIKYLITAWPDYADGGKYITSIDFNDPKITIYGLTVDSSFDEFERTFSEMGYKISNDGVENYEHYTASKKGINFSLKNVDGIRSFSIYADITNKKGIEY